MKFSGFIGPSYTLRSKNVDCQRCVNLYPEINELGTGKEQEVASLIGTPGLRVLQTLPQTPTRGGYTASNGVLYIAAGTKLYKFASDWTYTELGTLSTSTGVVKMKDNGLYLLIVDGPYGYTISLTDDSTFAQIVDDNFLGADFADYLDGYFIINRPGTQIFQISGLRDITWNGLDIGSSEGSPDNLIGLMVVHRVLYLLNVSTSEAFYDSGAADFPFERIEGAFVEKGIIAKHSLAKHDNAIYWLGQDESGAGIVYTATSYQPQRVSTTAVEYAIQQYGNMADATAYCYQQDGHAFYVLNFPSANTTWVFDSSSSMWHERTYTNDGQQERHRADWHAFAYETHVVGDYADGRVYALDNNVFDDDGAAIVRKRVTPHVSSGLTRVFYNSLQVDVESGVGLDGNTQGTDPQMMLKFSDDGGHTWSNEKWVSFGKIGNRHKRAIWRRLGYSRDRVFDVTISDPVKVTLINAQLDVEKGVA